LGEIKVLPELLTLVNPTMTGHIWPRFGALQTSLRALKIPFNLGELKQLHAGSTLGIAELSAFQ